MEARRDVFQAIADPTRRAIIGLIAGTPMKVSDIAENFDYTRQAISLHVRILEECGLIEIRQRGRERYCEAKLSRLKEVSEWTAQYTKFWQQKLDALGTYLDQLPVQKGKPRRKNI